MNKIEKITQNIKDDKELMKRLTLSYYHSSDLVDLFLKDADRYIRAISDRSMICVINSVSSSGMSRNISFYHLQKNGYKEFNVLNFNCLFKSLGYTYINNGFRISGCGMNMIFHTNYTNIHNFLRLGIISKKQCEELAQITPHLL